MSAAIEVTQLPDDVREKLAELELELSEGEKTFSTILYQLTVILLTASFLIMMLTCKVLLSFEAAYY